ncbi:MULTISPECIES: hypothetical protein [Sphingobacterium]|nr:MULTISPECIES: hypothetical protein [Sphingobacterium]
MGKNRKWFRNKFAVFPEGVLGEIKTLLLAAGLEKAQPFQKWGVTNLE